MWEFLQICWCCESKRIQGRHSGAGVTRANVAALTLHWRTPVAFEITACDLETRPETCRSNVEADSTIERRILLLRGQRVMLSPHLAELYGVAAKALVQAVKRNRQRFPADFQFQLTVEEFQILKSQLVTSSWGGMRRARPYAFTEQGVAMLSSVLRSPRAIAVNIEIMRAFVQLRRMLDSNAELARKVAELEGKYDGKFKAVFEAIRQLMAPSATSGKRIGFRREG